MFGSSPSAVLMICLNLSEKKQVLFASDFKAETMSITRFCSWWNFFAF